MSPEDQFSLGKVTCWQLPASLNEKAEAKVLEAGRTTLFSESPSVRACSTISQLTFCLNAQEIVCPLTEAVKLLFPSVKG